MAIFNKSARKPKTVGILTTRTRTRTEVRTDQEAPFENRSFYQRLTMLGHKLGLTVYVFTPCSVDWEQERVQGYRYDLALRCWERCSFELPPVIYDRCFFSSKPQQAVYREALRRLRDIPSVRLLSNGLKDKWTVQQMLAASGQFNRHLPPTELLRSMRTLGVWLAAHGEAVLKPLGGSQGRGVLLVRRGEAGAAHAYTVRGRDARNRDVSRGFADAAALGLWLRRFIGRRRYLVQRYLALHTSEGRAYDVRALMQKDGSGRWQLTGLAVRCGQGGSLTANLHGGGSAEAAEPFLARQFGRARAAQLLEELQQLSEAVPPVLEADHGRLAELGIDYGIDTAGCIWLLEVNSKPGRSIFTYIQHQEAQTAAAANPLRYADYMLRHEASIIR
ncbi:YheC/YheD family protein [Paenibacillus sp. YYML68]|uniref:YheC/YheD family endospore coat-associated protein n=1 Tax=Paenibacillus sp. YYML68 TaxID=2909250 RepID=UPI0024927369|nr:YheC/YheD family protein [Paenibacillus sp. YYML68]